MRTPAVMMDNTQVLMQVVLDGVEIVEAADKQ